MSSGCSLLFWGDMAGCDGFSARRFGPLFLQLDAVNGPGGLAVCREDRLAWLSGKGIVDWGPLHLRKYDDHSPGAGEREFDTATFSGQGGRPERAVRMNV